ncbi:MAG TPA: exopolysaccharide biosynthesis polyprenyl glycosylphosphotransferase [Acidimicrobiia bacterium]|nr:exopolysaccharide biosynthesis polyprenyl glycosylphosphotransferase [Acidimicrobiia bacterium]
MRRLARAGLYAGTVVAVLGFSKFHAHAHGYDFTQSSRFLWALGYVALLGATAYGVGLPDATRTRRAAVFGSLAAVGAAVAGISLVQLAGGAALLPRAVVFGAAAVLVPWYVLCARVARDVRVRAEERERVVVVAEAHEVENLYAELDGVTEQHALVVAILTPDEACSDDPPRQPLVDAARRSRATLVVLSRTAQAEEDIVAQTAQLHESGLRVRTLSLFYEQWLGKLPVGELERVSLFFDVGELHTPTYARVKRLLDVVLATIGLLFLAAVTPIVAVANCFGNRGPLLFRQPRVGRNGVVFSMLKFRTMQVDQSRTYADLTGVGDPRITPFGRMLRRAHLDELPQVLNVLRGDLSVVGPRPEQPHLVDEWSAKLPFYRLRHLVRPGLTGWAQVKYRYAGTEAETLEKLQYEFFYLRRQSLGLDLRIIGRTVRSVLGGDGR